MQLSRLHYPRKVFIFFYSNLKPHTANTFRSLKCALYLLLTSSKAAGFFSFSLLSFQTLTCSKHLVSLWFPPFGLSAFPYFPMITNCPLVIENAVAPWQGPKWKVHIHKYNRRPDGRTPKLSPVAPFDMLHSVHRCIGYYYIYIHSSRAGAGDVLSLSV